MAGRAHEDPGALAQAFRRQRSGGAYGRDQPGPPPKLSSGEWTRLRSELGQPPGNFGLEGKKWQGKLLQTHLASRYGIDFSLRQCQRLLKQYRQRPNGLAYKAGKTPGYTRAAERVGTE